MKRSPMLMELRSGSIANSFIPTTDRLGAMRSRIFRAGEAVVPGSTHDRFCALCRCYEADEGPPNCSLTLLRPDFAIEGGYQMDRTSCSAVSRHTPRRVGCWRSSFRIGSSRAFIQSEAATQKS